MNYVKHPTVKVGDTVRCLKQVTFITGHSHLPNDLLKVEADTLAYYQACLDNRHYELVTSN
jgi:hypothetical protein